MSTDTDTGQKHTKWLVHTHAVGQHVCIWWCVLDKRGLHTRTHTSWRACIYQCVYDEVTASRERGMLRVTSDLEPDPKWNRCWDVILKCVRHFHTKRVSFCKIPAWYLVITSNQLWNMFYTEWTLDLHEKQCHRALTVWRQTSFKKFFTGNKALCEILLQLVLFICNDFGTTIIRLYNDTVITVSLPQHHVNWQKVNLEPCMELEFTSHPGPNPLAFIPKRD